MEVGKHNVQQADSNDRRGHMKLLAFATIYW